MNFHLASRTNALALQHLHCVRRNFASRTGRIGPTGLHIEHLDQTFPYVWLRDSCQSSTCIHPSSRQKLHRSSDIPLDIRPATSDSVVFSESGVAITWTDGHQSQFTWEFLQHHAWPRNLSLFHQYIPRIPWTHYSILSAPHISVAYTSLSTPSGLLAAVNHLSAFGILFVKNVPNDKTSDHECELRVLAEKFSKIRETFYGQVWDVKNIANSRNIAYTNLGLGLHMDLLYFQSPPQYQILHCLRNRVSDGTSIFVDSLHAAERLRAEYPSDFAILTETLVPFHYINDGHHLHFEHPTIELSKDGQTILQINYSPPFQAPLLLSTPPEFYSALRRFTGYLDGGDNAYTCTLREGEAVLFDNRRVLHARSAFSDIPGTEIKDGEANRWLKGCYLDGDVFWDRARILRERLAA